jgi:hypothetical protein
MDEQAILVEGRRVRLIIGVVDGEFDRRCMVGVPSLVRPGVQHGNSGCDQIRNQG